MRDLIGTLRQWTYPAPLRISPPAWPTGLDAEIRRFAAELEALAADPGPAPPTDTGSEDMDRLREVATGLWRLRRKMVETGTEDRPLEPMRKAYRHLESTWDALSSLGIVIQDHTGDRFDTGQTLKVLAYEPAVDLTEERVVETVKPTVYYRDRVLQIGEVIVGVPHQDEASNG